MHGLEVARAERLLGCRSGASADEVRQAYRQALFRTRPDLGAASGDWVVELQFARDLLLAAAPPDRRRRPRRGPASVSQSLVRRRATWGLTEPADSSVDVRI